MVTLSANFTDMVMKKKLKGISDDDAPKEKLEAKKRKLQEDLPESHPKKKKSKTKEDLNGVSPEGSSKEKEETPEKTQEEKDGDLTKFTISQRTIDVLKERGVTYLFPVQAKTYNSIYEGQDVVAQARTGTGKTLSFTLPIVERLLQNKITQYGRPPRVLVMAPTRELARQVCEDLESVGASLATLCVYGGTPYGPQIHALKRGLDAVVGTPGRILDLIEKNHLDLGHLKHVVLDEMDRMLDMGFAETIEKILKQSYKTDKEDKADKPQTLLFSATVPDWVHDVASKYLSDNTKHFNLVGRDRTQTATTVQHLAIQCGEQERMSVISDIVQVYSGQDGNTLIFTQTKLDCDTLGRSKQLRGRVQVLHGDIVQQRREQVLQGFRKGQFRILVATDVAARGLDIPEVDLVIQCSPPKDIDSYIHRSGRTGRAGRTGTCICFYTANESRTLRNVERIAKIKFKRIGPPTAKSIVTASSDIAIEALSGVSEAASECFKERAKQLVEEKGAVECVAAALAILSGNKEVANRSLLTCQQGQTTYILRCTAEFDEGYCRGVLQSQLTSEVTRVTTNMQMCADRMGCIFDVPSEYDKRIAEKWQDDNCHKLEVATDLPELAPAYQSSWNRGGYGGRGSWNQGRGGAFGRGGGFSRGVGGGRGRGSYRGGQSGGFGQSSGFGQPSGFGQSSGYGQSGGYRGGWQGRGGQQQSNYRGGRDSYNNRGGGGRDSYSNRGTGSRDNYSSSRGTGGPGWKPKSFSNPNSGFNGQNKRTPF